MRSHFDFIISACTATVSPCFLTKINSVSTDLGLAMIGIPTTNSLQSATISGVCHEGLTVKTRDGGQAYLAVVDASGNILESGPLVAREVWNVTLAVYKNFLIGKGHLRIFNAPPGDGVIPNESTTP